MEIMIKEGQTALQVLSIINLEEIHVVLDKELEVYKDYKVTEQTEKGDKETLEKLKNLRKPVKDLRAKANKELKAITESQLKKIDDITAKLDNVIQPIESGLGIFAEERRLEKRRYKDSKFLPLIKSANEDINNHGIPFLNVSELSMIESWYGMSDDKITTALDEEIKKRVDQIKDAKNRIDILKIYADSIKEQYMLKADIDIFFKGLIYNKDISELKEMIEEKAAEQFKIENVVLEKIQEGIKVKDELTNNSEKHLKINEQERELNKVLNQNKYDVVIRFELLETEKAKEMIAYFKNNNIEYEVVSRTKII